MDDHTQLQTDLQALKQENAVLQQKFEEIQAALNNSSQELSRLHSLEQDIKKIPKFSKDIIIDCLKSVRKQDRFDKDQTWLIEQILTIIEYIWPKLGESELKKIDTKDFSGQNDVKALKDSNQKLKDSFEETKERCKVLASQLEDSSRELQSKEHKIVLLQSHKEQLIYDLALREEELSEVKKQLAQIDSLKNERQELQESLKTYEDSLEKTQAELAGFKFLSESVEKLEQSMTELEELKTSEGSLRLECTSLKSLLVQTTSDFNSAQHSLRYLETSSKELEEQLRTTKHELEDMKTERQIIQKRSMHDLKDLKSDLAKEKTAHELCKIEKEKAVQENKKLQESLRAGVKLPAPSLNEKTLVETMANRVTELERINLALRHKVRETECYVVENERLCKENEELRNEINKLSEDLAMMGARLNEHMRSQRGN